MSESERLAELINHLKTNASQFSIRANIAQGSISNIINGKKRITRDIIDAIMTTHPNVSLDWLMKGVGGMFLIISEDQAIGTSEPMPEYFTEKSIVSTPNDRFPTEEKMKGIIADNLRLAGKRWKLNQAEMLELLGGDVGRGGASTYFRGDTLPRLPLLLRLERYTGWSLVVLATRALSFDQIPPAPLMDAPVEPTYLSAAEQEDLKGELHRLKLRIARIIEQMEQK